MVSVSNTTATNKQGLSAYAQYFFVNNQFKIWWTQSIVSKNYDPQLGFVSRNDVIGIGGNVGGFGGVSLAIWTEGPNHDRRAGGPVVGRRHRGVLEKTVDSAG